VYRIKAEPHTISNQGYRESRHIQWLFGGSLHRYLLFPDCTSFMHSDRHVGLNFLEKRYRFMFFALGFLCAIEMSINVEASVWIGHYRTFSCHYAAWSTSSLAQTHGLGSS
jgi:hypothetical protein